MINKEMNTNKSANEKVLSAIIDEKTEKVAKPNESSGIYFSSSIISFQLLTISINIQ
jgi:hypothetical protein